MRIFPGRGIMAAGLFPAGAQKGFSPCRRDRQQFRMTDLPRLQRRDHTEYALRDSLGIGIAHQSRLFDDLGAMLIDEDGNIGDIAQGDMDLSPVAGIDHPHPGSQTDGPGAAPLFDKKNKFGGKGRADPRRDQPDIAWVQQQALLFKITVHIVSRVFLSFGRQYRAILAPGKI